MEKTIKGKKQLKGDIQVPGDKSISHRAVMLGAISEGVTEIRGFLMGDDCLHTISCFQQMGIDIKVEDNAVFVMGKGLKGLTKPKDTLDVGNSGTTIRLLSAILAAQDFPCIINGDASIQKRPMGRIITPLKEMGAEISGRDGRFAPLHILGHPLNGISYRLPVASAQVKSAVILAGLYAQGKTEIIEETPSRNHTELMLRYFGGDVEKIGNVIHVTPGQTLIGKKVAVPGDISSAAYFIAAGLLAKDSELTIQNVGVNPTRAGIINVLKAMGGNITLKNQKTIAGEDVADIHVQSSELKGTTIGGEIIPTLIDEIPVLAVCGVLAKGTTIIKDAAELKVKESNRIQTMTTELRKLGAIIEETEDGMMIEGGIPLKGAVCESYHDHRVAMSIAIAGLNADGETTIQNTACIDISFPGFFQLLDSIAK